MVIKIFYNFILNLFLDYFLKLIFSVKIINIFFDIFYFYKEEENEELLKFK